MELSPEVAELVVLLCVIGFRIWEHLWSISFLFAMLVLAYNSDRIWHFFTKEPEIHRWRTF